MTSSDYMPEKNQRRWFGVWRTIFILLLGGYLALLGGYLITRIIPNFCWQNSAACTRIAYYRHVAPVLSNDTSPNQPAAVTTKPRTHLDDRPFYGMQYVPESDLDRVAALGINTVLQDFPLNGTPQDWVDILDTAQERELKVVAWQWPSGWEWDENSEEWTIDSQASLFLETVADHPALFAVYGTHEAYWNGCFGCQYTTAQLQTLYNQIKNITDVPIYSAFESYKFWREYSTETTFADGVCDYCDTWYYPVRTSEYNRDEYIQRLNEEIATFRELAPNSKFVWAIQGFGSAEYERVMPSAEQMHDMASLALSSDVDGVWWYVWQFSDVYEDYLVNYPQLHPTIRDIYEEYLNETEQPESNWYLPIVDNRMQFIE